MLVSSRGEYALRMLCELARNGETAILNIAELSRRIGMHRGNARHLSNTLARAGLLESSRGKHGGYRLARPSCEISVQEVLGATGDVVCVAPCTRGEVCQRDCGVKHGVYAALDKQIREHLSTTTVYELARRTPPVRVSTCFVSMFDGRGLSPIDEDTRRRLRANWTSKLIVALRAMLGHGRHEHMGPTQWFEEVKSTAGMVLAYGAAAHDDPISSAIRSLIEDADTHGVEHERTRARAHAAIELLET